MLNYCLRINDLKEKMELLIWNVLYFLLSRQVMIDFPFLKSSKVQNGPNKWFSFVQRRKQSPLSEKKRIVVMIQQSRRISTGGVFTCQHLAKELKRENTKYLIRRIIVTLSQVFTQDCNNRSKYVIYHLTKMIIKEFIRLLSWVNSVYILGYANLIKHNQIINMSGLSSKPSVITSLPVL